MLRHALGVGVYEIGGGLAAVREGLHRFLVQDPERLHLDLVGAIVLHKVELGARPRQAMLDNEMDGRANPAELGLERLAPSRSFVSTRKIVGLEIQEGARALAWRPRA